MTNTKTRSLHCSSEPPDRPMRRLVIPLLAAHSVSFVALCVSYLFCSRLLSPVEFGAYTTALAVGAIAALVLDGGIKISIIKSTVDLTPKQCGSLLLTMMALAACLILVLGALFWMREAPRIEAVWGDELVAAFAAIYIVSYPWIGISTALLERQLQYARIARIEALSIAVERLLPIAMLVIFKLGLPSFAIGLLVGRALRVAQLTAAAPVAPGMHEFSTVQRLFSEGVWTQIGSGAAAVRDNLHVLIVGPFFGTSWVGYYGWAMQLGTMASQLFSQVVARIALPVAAQTTGWHQRWAICLSQIRVLAITTAPLLAMTVLMAPWLNKQFFQGKWEQSLPLLSLFCIRMIPGVATSPLVPLLLVERGTRSYAIASIAWSIAELGGAIIMVLIMGSTGLAYSYSLMAWFGIAALIHALRRDSLRQLRDACTSILAGPSVAVAGAWAIAGITLIGTDRLAVSPLTSVSVALGTALSCLMLDRELRSTLLGRRRQE